MELLSAILLFAVIAFVWWIAQDDDPASGHPYRCDVWRKTKDGKQYRVVKWSDDDNLVRWTYDNKPMRYRPKKAIGFVYVVTFSDGMMYLGRKTFDWFGDWWDYAGSGELVLERLRKRSKASQITERLVLEVYYNYDEMCRAEEYAQREMDVVNNPDFLNLRIGQE